MRMATSPQMTFSSQSQQFTWCCLRGTCSSWFLQNGARGDLGRLTPSRKQCPWQAGEAPGGRIPALHTPCELHTQDMEQGCSRALKHRKRQGHQHPGSGKGCSWVSAAVAGMQVQVSASCRAFREPQSSLCLHQWLLQFLNISPFGKNLSMFYDERIMTNDK